MNAYSTPPLWGDPLWSPALNYRDIVGGGQHLWITKPTCWLALTP